MAPWSQKSAIGKCRSPKAERAPRNAGLSIVVINQKGAPVTTAVPQNLLQGARRKNHPAQQRYIATARAESILQEKSCRTNELYGIFRQFCAHFTK